ncbi:MAG: hypothetical protein RJQ09_19135 [Cyclobacteriaceae bacterium]
MKSLLTSLLVLIIPTALQAQMPEEPLKSLEYYMGIWIPPLNHPMTTNNPKMAHLQVIAFEWGAQKKVIKSTTGIISDEYNIPFSEGTITYNPLTKKIVWLEYQYDGDLLFEGEYKPLADGSMERLYTVYYVEGDKTIPNPQEGGWTRLYRETFTPFHQDTIAWKTETYIGEKWIKAGSDGFKAVRKKY